jgi:hypothetical protein
MKIPHTATALALPLVLASLIAGCGSGSPKTVTVTRTVAAKTTASTTSAAATSTTSASRTSTSTSSSTTTTTATTTTATSTAAAPATTTTSTATTTRTETGPAFVAPSPSPGGALGAAIALLARKGYMPLDTSSYHPGDTLRVLIGRASGGERAFFFDQGSYLGIDASAASAQISVISHNDTEVTLAYAIFRPGATSPSGHRRVRFALDMGQLSPVDAIPSVALRR